MKKVNTKGIYATSIGRLLINSKEYFNRKDVLRTIQNIKSIWQK